MHSPLVKQLMQSSYEAQIAATPEREAMIALMQNEDSATTTDNPMSGLGVPYDYTASMDNQSLPPTIAPPSSEYNDDRDDEIQWQQEQMLSTATEMTEEEFMQQFEGPEEESQAS